MHKLFEWLAINALFVLLGLVAAAVVLLLGTPLVAWWPAARNEWLPGLLLGLAGVAAALIVARVIISRPPRQGRGRDPV